jgi:hypothetical protein
MDTETCRYRGYEMVPTRALPHWLVSIHPTRPDLPLSAHPTLRTHATCKEDALNEARQRVNEILSSFRL